MRREERPVVRIWALEVSKSEGCGDWKRERSSRQAVTTGPAEKMAAQRPAVISKREKSGASVGMGVEGRSWWSRAVEGGMWRVGWML